MPGDRAIRNQVKVWSKSLLVRSVQRLWIQTGVPLRTIIDEGPLPRSRAYAILVHGTPNPEVHNLDLILKVLRRKPQWNRWDPETDPIDPLPSDPPTTARTAKRRREEAEASADSESAVRRINGDPVDDDDDEDEGLEPSDQS